MSDIGLNTHKQAKCNYSDIKPIEKSNSVKRDGSKDHLIFIQNSIKNYMERCEQVKIFQ